MFATTLPTVNDQQIETAIFKTDFIRGKNVTANVHDGVVTLRGQVDSFYEKQMAQESIRHIPRIVRIQNDVAVTQS